MKSDRARQISYDIIYIWNIKKDTNELICRTETDPQILKTNMLTKGAGRGEGWIGALGLAYEHCGIWTDLAIEDLLSTQGILTNIL